ncbi:RWD domain-containing protein 3-like [Gigantopelta aegis]|uniref:RWD domain-containing protein 3-like n=1 Tax=Gigantopelta aegis TaxID=1735272 RepID=UPI001B8883DA|nr:RWD domain-containing protein 3-like [Gigantopelta aegis]
MAEDEILVLKSIYCLPGEVQVIDEANGAKEITLNVCKGEFKPQAKVVFSIPSKYPLATPHISLFSENIDPKNIKHIRYKLYSLAENHKGSPMLMNLIDFLQQELLGVPPVLDNHSAKMRCHAPELSGRSLSEEDGEKSDFFNGTKYQHEMVSTILLYIDHMRAKTKYVKLIEKWVKELELTGRLLFCNRLILLLLQGESDRLKEYITKHKTSIVDVDSKGHPCKEKMMSVLCNKQLDNQSSFSDFEVVEYACLEDLREAFQKYKMDNLFENYVLGIKGLKFS